MLFRSGKMGREIVKALGLYKNELSIYSRSEERSNEKLANRDISQLNEMQNLDILLLATDADRPIINKEFLEYRGIRPSIIFDLSLPRNCDQDVLEMEGIQLYHLSDLLAKSRKDRKSTRLNSSHIPLSRMPSSA